MLNYACLKATKFFIYFRNYVFYVNYLRLREIGNANIVKVKKVKQRIKNVSSEKVIQSSLAFDN